MNTDILYLKTLFGTESDSELPALDHAMRGHPREVAVNLLARLENTANRQAVAQALTHTPREDFSLVAWLVNQGQAHTVIGILEHDTITPALRAEIILSAGTLDALLAHGYADTMIDHLSAIPPVYVATLEPRHLNALRRHQSDKTMYRVGALAAQIVAAREEQVATPASAPAPAAQS
jgi:hypothetical protein